MRKTISTLLRTLADWLYTPTASYPVLPTDIPAELKRAIQLVSEAETLTDTSGEYKRHVVYARLIKEFPQVSKRFLSMQIEKALE